MNTKTLKQTNTELENNQLFQLILINDDVNTFEHVIEMLIKFCNHDSVQAEQCALLVHYKGKCAIKKGALKELNLVSEILSENGLTVEIN